MPIGWLDVHKVYDYYRQNPQALREDQVAAHTNYVRNRRFFYERVSAGYLMGSNSYWKS